MTDLASPTGPSADVDGASLSDQLVQLMRVMHALKAQSASDPEARERAAHVLLFPLTRVGAVRQGALAELVHADPSTVSRHVASLVDQGLVRRIADEQDGRASLLVVTPAGQAVVDQLRAERNALLAQVTADWTTDEITVFRRQLHRFVQDLTAQIPTTGVAVDSA